MNIDTLSKMTVAQLKELCKENGLPVSGKKAELISRLLPVSENEIVVPRPQEAVLAFDDSSITGDSLGDQIFNKMKEPLLGPVPAGAVAAVFLAIMLTTAAFVFQPTWLGFAPEYEYELIDYNPSRTRAYAQALVDLGHSEWEGRMSGSAEELAAAENITAHFQSLGMQTTLHEFKVPMFAVNAEPSLRVCAPGLTGACEGIFGVGAQIEAFQHRVDYVIQGFSGYSNYNFGDGLTVTDLGNGTDDALWSSATGTIGYVRSGGSIGGNTGIMSNAAENGLAGIIRVNKDYNCGKIEATDCVAIFKGTGIDDVTKANGGSIPTDLPFIAMSRDAGEILEAFMINGTGQIEMKIDVTNDQERSIYVPCGEIKGKSSEVVIAGGHHDTVYHGQGAVDDTSGTSSVMEMATQISKIVEETGKPERTLRFCTWGGEEEGLYGSRAYVDAMKSKLKNDLRLYINLDMNHVDKDFAERGNGISLFTNNEEDFDHITAITKKYQKERADIASRYEIRLSLLDGPKGASDGMPYNSDHGPFVYDMGGGDDGRAVVCYGSGSWEYHTYADTMDRFNEESLGVSVVIYGTYMRMLAYNADA